MQHGKTTHALGGQILHNSVHIRWMLRGKNFAWSSLRSQLQHVSHVPCLVSSGECLSRGCYGWQIIGHLEAVSHCLFRDAEMWASAEARCSAATSTLRAILASSQQVCDCLRRQFPTIAQRRKILFYSRLWLYCLRSLVALLHKYVGRPNNG